MVLMHIQLSIRGGSELQERGGWYIHGDVVCLRYVWGRELGVSPFHTKHGKLSSLYGSETLFRAWALVENGTRTLM